MPRPGQKKGATKSLLASGLLRRLHGYALRDHFTSDSARCTSPIRKNANCVRGLIKSALGSLLPQSFLRGLARDEHGNLSPGLLGEDHSLSHPYLSFGPHDGNDSDGALRDATHHFNKARIYSTDPTFAIKRGLLATDCARYPRDPRGSRSIASLKKVGDERDRCNPVRWLARGRCGLSKTRSLPSASGRRADGCCLRRSCRSWRYRQPCRRSAY